MGDEIRSARADVFIPSPSAYIADLLTPGVPSARFGRAHSPIFDEVHIK